MSAFEKKGDRWVRVLDSLMGDAPDDSTWIDHSYGQQILKDAKGGTWMFYERVTQEQDGHPWTTELFARRMSGPFLLEEREHRVSPMDLRRWPALRRSFGGTLAEGARPVWIAGWYVMGFSGGDYTSERYGIHLLASRNIEGPYEPYLNSAADDIEDFGAEVEQLHPMIWGAARPAFFEVEGEWWVLFHGILKSDQKQVDAGFRDVYLAPVQVIPQMGRPPRIQIRSTLELR